MERWKQNTAPIFRCLCSKSAKAAWLTFLCATVICWLQLASRLPITGVPSRDEHFENICPESARSPARTPAASNVSTKSSNTSASSFGKDHCLQKPTNFERAECLQPILEMYYGSEMSLSCPNLGLILSHDCCVGCPWNLAEPSSNMSVAVSSFHKAESSCNIAEHVKIYANLDSIFGTHITSLSIAALITLGLSVAGFTSREQVTVLGHHVPEAFFLGIHWLALNVCFFLHFRASDFTIFCESMRESWLNRPTLTVLYGTGLYVSVSRCFKMPSNVDAPRDDAHHSSWAVFVAETYAQRESKTRRQRILALVAASLPCLVFIVFLVTGAVYFEVGDRTAPGRCSPGYKDYAMGAIQISKIFIETWSILVYAIGGFVNDPFYKRLRKISLEMIIFASLVIFSLNFTPWHRPNSLSSTLFSRVQDRQIAGYFTEVFHAFAIAVLGWLEPYRIEAQEAVPLPANETAADIEERSGEAIEEEPESRETNDSGDIDGGED